MTFDITQGTLGVRPKVSLPNPEFLTALTEEGMRQLIHEHYEILSKSSISQLFPPEGKALEMAKKHSADFFIQICGGPQYFNENRGAPRMAARHMPFKITPSARLVWLEAYISVLEKLDINEDLKESFWNYLDVFSIWMINTPED